MLPRTVSSAIGSCSLHTSAPAAACTARAGREDRARRLSGLGDVPGAAATDPARWPIFPLSVTHFSFSCHHFLILTEVAETHRFAAIFAEPALGELLRSVNSGSTGRGAERRRGGLARNWPPIVPASAPRRMSFFSMARLSRRRFSDRGSRGSGGRRARTRARACRARRSTSPPGRCRRSSRRATRGTSPRRARPSSTMPSGRSISGTTATYVTSTRR